MNKINKIAQLTETLDKIAPKERAKTMKRINIAPSELAAYATWSDDCYTRNCLARTEKYELILLCWEVGAQAPVHGHGGEECWVYQVKGSVEEIRFTQIGETLKETNRMTLSPGKLTYMNDEMGYHSIGNVSEERALTLHIYALPIDSCKVYNTEDGCFEVKEMSYHTFRGEEVEVGICEERGH